MRAIYGAGLLVISAIWGCQKPKATAVLLPDLKFDRVAWRKHPESTGKQTVRSRMVNDLLRTGLAAAKNGKQVIELLGPPDLKADPVSIEGFERSPDGTVAWVYDVASFENENDAIFEIVAVLVDRKGKLLKSRKAYRM